jgi:hypothetical protein
MDYKKTIFQIKFLEEKQEWLFNELKNHSIFDTKNNNYTDKDKKDFLLLWGEYVILFKNIEKLIKKNKYRKFIIFKNYSKLVLQRYLLRFYFHILQQLLIHFWNNERFIRQLLKENTTDNYGRFSSFVYKPKYINIYNIPSLFLKPYKIILNKNIIEYIKVSKFISDPLSRVRTDSSNLYFHCKHTTDKWIFKLMKVIWNFISHIRFSKRKTGLITDKNLNKYLELAQPWDILLTRWNWNATNISIPGFWKHMSLYMWTWKYLSEKFWYKKLENKKHYIIESTAEWVILKLIQELTQHNDYLWVIRSNFSLDKRKRIIKKAWEQIWKGYDYIFNFHSDSSLVCSELVLKSYSKDDKNDEGFNIKLENIGMWVTFPPNNILKILNKQQLNKKPKIYPYFFIYSIEKTHKNFINSSWALLNSGHRSRFSFFLK